MHVHVAHGAATPLPFPPAQPVPPAAAAQPYLGGHGGHHLPLACGQGGRGGGDGEEGRHEVAAAPAALAGTRAAANQRRNPMSARVMALPLPGLPSHGTLGQRGGLQARGATSLAAPTHRSPPPGRPASPLMRCTPGTCAARAGWAARRRRGARRRTGEPGRTWLGCLGECVWECRRRVVVSGSSRRGGEITWGASLRAASMAVDGRPVVRAPSSRSRLSNPLQRIGAVTIDAPRRLGRAAEFGGQCCPCTAAQLERWPPPWPPLSPLADRSDRLLAG
jgi:hypothetical protein